MPGEARDSCASCHLDLPPLIAERGAVAGRRLRRHPVLPFSVTREVSLALDAGRAGEPERVLARLEQGLRLRGVGSVERSGGTLEFSGVSGRRSEFDPLVAIDGGRIEVVARAGQLVLRCRLRFIGLPVIGGALALAALAAAFTLPAGSRAPWVFSLAWLELGIVLGYAWGLMAAPSLLREIAERPARTA